MHKCYDNFEEDLVIAQLDTVKEQDEIKNYVYKKSLIRPNTNAFTIIIIFISIVVFGIICSFLIIKLTNNENNSFLIFLLVCLSIFILTSRLFCIKLVECYQHYAKVETRRKCLCRPTCSEYAIISLKKYFLPVALFKILKRLLKTCRGGIYKNDEP
ncbi:MAG: membrane protein insertion efficiency factor YidD [Clostridia bacterium]|nr:membrane protein insertion efficiency factor YidD [Clostridia bacterium]